MKPINNFLFSIFLITISLQSQTKLPSVFGDNMVLQQKENAAFWGNDVPNSAITIATSWGDNAKTVTDKNGNWKTTIKIKKASFIRETITIKGASVITLNNVLIGEVWFCSGQSNMEMDLGGLRKSKVLNAQKYIAIANNKNIRLFNTPKTASVLPSKNVNASWQESTEVSAKKFSAIGYIFAVQLYKKLNVPIGIIEASWGGTRIESWIPKRDLMKYEDIKFFDVLPQNIQKQKKPSILYNGMIHPFQNFTIKGFLWYQGESNRMQPSPYKNYIKDLIFSWRSQWKNNKLPFTLYKLHLTIIKSTKKDLQLDLI